MRFLFFIFFWFLYFPLLRILSAFLFWNGKLELRERFEKRNKFESLAHSFKDKNMVADICFEFSSEGEFQQVAPLIDDALLRGQKIELVFFSPSVEKGVMQLAARHPSQIRYLRYPLVRLLPFIERRSFTHWVTAKTLVMVRYDLFPEFLLWGMKKDHTLKMVWMTFKKERSKGKGPSFFKKLFLKYSETVVFATEEDQKMGKGLGISGSVYDFRTEQIRRRMEGKENKFQLIFPAYQNLKKRWDEFPEHKRVILGNAWPSDLFLLRDVPHDYFVLIVPHQLEPAVLRQFDQRLMELKRDYVEVSDAHDAVLGNHTVVLNKKGVLCELYGDFQFSYVGGGFEVSIHSVLEPLMAQSFKISSGPMHFRSTEFDLAKIYGDMSEVNTPEQFMAWLNSKISPEKRDKLTEITNGYMKASEKVLTC